MNINYYVQETQFGKFLLNPKDLIGATIIERKYWEYHLIEFYTQILNQDSVCVDMGANIGFHSICFANICKKVHSFEPQNIIFNNLCANILINNLNDKIVVYKLGLGDKDEKAQLWDIENEGWVGNGIYNWGGRGIETETSSFTSDEVRENDIIEVTTLDKFNLKCDLIKIDVQGYEYKAFLGGKDTIISSKPTILLENYPEDNQSREFLFSLGYEGYRYCIGNEEDCIFIHPKSKNYKISLQGINSIQEKYNIKKI